MTIDRRILVDPHGAVLSAGRKVSTVKGLEQASNETQSVFESWCRWKPTGRLPRLSEIYPNKLGDVVPSVLVVDVLESEQDYRYRIIGALEAETRCSDPTGLTVRQIYGSRPEVMDFCLESYDLATASPWGIIDFSIEASANPRYLELETMFLPLSEDGARVTQILVYSHFVLH
ncbi:MAG TPA: hypothetical protein VHE77_07595 [Dongiaceae bacterium]|jgi:hypothetical protein|nr:hypothetical protein [Dongiaceae bacterium]HVY99876.1 hypothetical protein [Dongiaceae bacterium]